MQVKTQNAGRMLALVLAAGESRRFGSPKQIADVHQQPMLNRMITALVESQCFQRDDIYIALGANKENVRAVLSNEIQTIDVSDWHLGMGTSISESLSYLATLDVSHVMIVLADQVALTSNHIDELVQFSRLNNDKIVSAEYNNTLGVPAVFPRWSFPALQALSGERGAKVILQEQKQQNKALAFAMPEAAIDIDTQAQLADWVATN
ncbi:nucleotidyltransferase family protein [Paraneptunicella aestuarii]|uniref:nucleotidyltransferase family protein n=1 Tax=Paraneptunicella aestuarii TaxID=2831148 RepID=UPI001E4D294E|nr:nucleotidyltransferase family protein [Paraneptunicella aestuarii]UAA40537.1 nucleotidyltransferase family protein [Paraneptunicella aestuarii]